MPRDLSEEKGNVWKGMKQLDRHPDEAQRHDTYDEDSSSSIDDSSSSSSTPPTSARRVKGEAIKPYVQALNSLDIEACVALEEACFPPNERCSREKYQYRFTKCGELQLGLFTSADTTQTSNPPDASKPASARTASHAVPVYSGTPARKSILLGHVIATKTTNTEVKDEDMAIPTDWRAEHARSMTAESTIKRAAARPALSEPVLGHKEHGKTLLVHSLAVLPEFHGHGLGKLLMKSYLQRMTGSGVADRLALIAHEQLVPFYESLGFSRVGPSACTLGDGGWVDMAISLHGSGD